jgi:hypothetical protein
MVARQRPRLENVTIPLPALRFEISEAALILRMSRAQLYVRIQEGSIKPQKDGSRTYITRPELERYVEYCGGKAPQPEDKSSAGRVRSPAQTIKPYGLSRTP